VIRRREAILALLTALNLLNYLDRYLVMAVGPRFQADLGLTDSQLGLVETAFMVGYMLTSPIFGLLGDRMRRKQLIASGIAMWSIATAISGATHSLSTMYLARVAVGIGEASYATLSPTIIDDLSTPQTKNRNLAIFYSAIPVGSALGYVLGGILEPLYGWRSAFYIVGLPGVALAGVTLLIAEPERADRAKSAVVQGVYRALLKRGQYVDTVLGYVAQTFALGGFTAWAAPFLERRQCFELASGNKIFGYVTVLTGLAGTAIGGVLADRVKDVDRTRACLRVCAWSSAIAAPLALASLFAPSPTLFFVALAATELTIFVSVSPSNAAVLGSVPATMRASAMAASIFAIHLLGDLISPPAIGAISDHLGDAKTICSGGRGLWLGMFLLPAALLVSAIFWFRGTRQPIADASLQESPK
jgi:MFS family permease